MMTEFKTYTEKHTAPDAEIQQIVNFLHDHLDQYGDEKEDIEKSIHYAMGRNGKPGGLVITACAAEGLLGAVVLNKTGMGGYIPENILVYIAIDRNTRGTGLGKKLMQQAIEQSEGDIALHCEPDNPAKHLYNKLGFTSKYLEMRLKKY